MFLNRSDKHKKAIIAANSSAADETLNMTDQTKHIQVLHYESLIMTFVERRLRAKLILRLQPRVPRIMWKLNLHRNKRYTSHQLTRAPARFPQLKVVQGFRAFEMRASATKGPQTKVNLLPNRNTLKCKPQSPGQTPESEYIPLMRQST